MRRDGLAAVPAEDLVELIAQMTEQMHAAAAELQFELAARLRDEVSDLKKELRQMRAPATPERRRPPLQSGW